MVGQASAGVPGELPVPVTGQAGVAQPQAAVLALQHAIAIQIGQAVSGREGGDYAVLDARQSAAGAKHIDAAISGFHGQASLIGGEALFSGESRELGLSETVQTSGGADPQAAFRVFIER